MKKAWRPLCSRYKPILRLKSPQSSSAPVLRPNKREPMQWMLGEIIQQRQSIVYVNSKWCGSIIWWYNTNWFWKWWQVLRLKREPNAMKSGRNRPAGLEEWIHKMFILPNNKCRDLHTLCKITLVVIHTHCYKQTFKF